MRMYGYVGRHCGPGGGCWLLACCVGRKGHCPYAALRPPRRPRAVDPRANLGSASCSAAKTRRPTSWRSGGSGGAAGHRGTNRALCRVCELKSLWWRQVSQRRSSGVGWAGAGVHQNSPFGIRHHLASHFTAQIAHVRGETCGIAGCLNHRNSWLRSAGSAGRGSSSRRGREFLVRGPAAKPETQRSSAVAFAQRAPHTPPCTTTIRAQCTRIMPVVQYIRPC
jgi:hypothetical protein